MNNLGRTRRSFFTVRFVPIFSNALQTRYEKLQHKESEHISFGERLEELVVLNLEKEMIRVESISDEQEQSDRNKALQRKLPLTILSSAL